MSFFLFISYVATKINPIAKDVVQNTTRIKADVHKIPDLLQSLLNWSIESGKHIIVAIIIYYVGRIIIKIINKLVDKILAKKKIEISIRTFLRSLIKITLTILLIIAVINELGIDTTSLAALLAAAGVAIGMALSGNLQNFAGGIMVLLFKPYRVGDFIEAQNVSGTVKEIQVFHTILLTPDNRMIYIPNGPISSGLVTNYSKMDNRQIEWVIGIDYGENYDKVKDLLLSIIVDNNKILKTPEPFVALKALSINSVNVVVRVWVKSVDYWPTYYDINKTIYDTFNAQGINFPYPQMTIHQK